MSYKPKISRDTTGSLAHTFIWTWFQRRSPWVFSVRNSPCIGVWRMPYTTRKAWEHIHFCLLPSPWLIACFLVGRQDDAVLGWLLNHLPAPSPTLLVPLPSPFQGSGMCHMGNGSCGSRGECGHLLSPLPHFSFQEQSSRNLWPDWLWPKISIWKGENSTKPPAFSTFLFCFIFHLNILFWHSELPGREENDTFFPVSLSFFLIINTLTWQGVPSLSSGAPLARLRQLSVQHQGQHYTPFSAH